jgi:TM2 domain-containing membrane protein YozV
MDQKPRSQPGAQPASRIVAIVLAFVLGFVGAQYFYMGRRILAVLSVLFCWTGYPAIIGVLDGLRMIFLTDREFRQQCT